MYSFTKSESQPRLLLSGQQPTQSTSTWYQTGNSQSFFDGLRGEEVVISGVAGKLGEYPSLREWSRELYQTREPVQRQEERFSLSAFGFLPNEAVEPQLETLLKVTWQAIQDSGVSPLELKGTRTGVFVGVSGAAVNQRKTSSSASFLPEYFLQQTNQPTFASRLSYYFDFKGPNQIYEVTAPQSLIALDSAVKSIRAGLCDYAIVAGITYSTESKSFEDLVVVPQQQDQFTIGVVFLQRKTEIKTDYYAKVLHSKVQMDMFKDGYTQTNEDLVKFIRDVYTESRIDSNQINYVELHGQELNEINLIRDAFYSMRTVNQQTKTTTGQQLSIGSAKWNVGRLQSPTGIFSLIKVLVSIRRGQLPANIYHREQESDYPTWMQISDVNTYMTNGLIALSSINRGEAYVHTIIEPNADLILKSLDEQKQRLRQQVQTSVSQLRTPPNQETYEFQFERLDRQQQQQQKTTANGLVTRTVDTKQVKRQVWYLIADNGSQWRGSVKELMQIEQFRLSLVKSAEYLRPFGINLMQLLTREQQDDLVTRTRTVTRATTTERILHSSVVTPAIQIALIDLLRELNVEPDGIVGYSFGELVSAYVDNVLTHEETLLAAYYKGKIIEEANFPFSQSIMVSQLTWEEAQKYSTSTAIPSLHLAKDVVVFTGPQKSVQKLSEILKLNGYTVKDMEQINVPLHSYHMTPVVLQYQLALEKIIRQPKVKSSRWLNTQQTVEFKNETYVTPEYFVYSLVSPVRLYDAIKRIPSNAITIEIGPQSVLKEILRQTLGENTLYVNLLRSDEKYQLEYLFDNLSRLYTDDDVRSNGSWLQKLRRSESTTTTWVESQQDDQQEQLRGQRKWLQELQQERTQQWQQQQQLRNVKPRQFDQDLDRQPREVRVPLFFDETQQLEDKLTQSLDYVQHRLNKEQKFRSQKQEEHYNFVLEALKQRNEKMKQKLREQIENLIERRHALEEQQEQNKQEEQQQQPQQTWFERKPEDRQTTRPQSLLHKWQQFHQRLDEITPQQQQHQAWFERKSEDRQTSRPQSLLHKWQQFHQRLDEITPQQQQQQKWRPTVEDQINNYFRQFYLDDSVKKSDDRHVWTYEIDLYKDMEELYLNGHKIDGKTFYPESVYFQLVRRSFANLNKFKLDEQPISFEDVRFHRHVYLLGNRVTLKVVLHSGQFFEVYESNRLVVSGRVYVPDEVQVQKRQLKQEMSTNNFLSKQ